MDDYNLRDLAAEGATAGLFGMLGRLVHIAMLDRRPFGWNLLWELPVAISMGVVGIGMSDWLQLKPFASFAVTIAVSYLGPRVIDLALTRISREFTRTGSGK